MQTVEEVVVAEMELELEREIQEIQAADASSVSA